MPERVVSGLNHLRFKPERHARQDKEIFKAPKAQYRTDQGNNPGFGGDKYVSPDKDSILPRLFQPA
jgi:hypothetical protein